jgi:hypothetical protein
MINRTKVRRLALLIKWGGRLLAAASCGIGIYALLFEGDTYQEVLGLVVGIAVVVLFLSQSWAWILEGFSQEGRQPTAGLWLGPK